jgi:hypothetical protein
MQAEHDLKALNAAASAAAAAGDFAGAVSLLRQALDRQMATLGPDHPDLATTLNNLALMLEQLGDTDEAGRCYRRAYRIALAALGPDDPAVSVSHANLAAFYRAHGSAGDEVAESMLAGLRDFSSVDEDLGTVIPADPLPAQVLPPPTAPLAPASQRRPTAAAPRPEHQLSQAAPAGRRTRAAIIGAAVVLLSAAGWWALPPQPATRGTSATVDATSPSRAAEPAPPTGASAPAAPVAQPDKLPADDAPRAAVAPTKDAPRLPPSGSIGTAAIRVADARLCAALSPGGAWRCQPLANERQGGAVYFYTRVASQADAVVRHRWTRNGDVVRVVDLRIRANPKEGFRTYSRQTGRALEPGEWRVALLDAAGAVLDEETFVIR